MGRCEGRGKKEGGREEGKVLIVGEREEEGEWRKT